MYIALNASSKLTGVVGVGVATVPVTAGTGTQFAVGSNHSYVTFQDATNKETCKITGQSGDNLTVVRTKSLSWGIGTVIECRPCAEAMADYAAGRQIDGSGAAAIADADSIGFVDASASSVLAKITWANIKATLKTYFDTLYATLSGFSVTGAINEARGTIAMHATTMDIWSKPNVIDGTGSAVTITAIPNAPQAGARRVLYPIAGSVCTAFAGMTIDGGGPTAASATGDAWEFEAVTTTTFKLHITKKDGTAVVASGISAASQAEQETGSSTSVATTPGRQQFHPSAAKAWINWNGTGTPAVRASYNMDGSTPITDNGTGDYTLNIGADMSSSSYAVALACNSNVGSTAMNAGVKFGAVATDVAAGSVRIKCQQSTTAMDLDWLNAIFYGDQA